MGKIKIAIYHNLKKGGALNSLNEISLQLSKQNKVNVLCPENEKPKNLFSEIYYILKNLKVINQEIAKDINKNNYDLILVFPCLLTQSPYLLR